MGMRGCMCRGRGRDARATAPVAAGAGAAEVWAAVSDGASDGGSAVQCRPRDYRVDGSGAWAVCAPGVVVAIAGEHSRKDEEV